MGLPVHFENVFEANKNQTFLIRQKLYSCAYWFALLS